MRSFIWVACLLASALISCKNKEKTAAAPAQNPVATESAATSTDQKRTLVLSYERTACFGTCPVYKMNLYSDGYATYEGRIHTPYIGPHEGKFDPETVESITALIREQGYKNWKANYESMATDLPSRILTINLDGANQKIVDGGGEAPEGLRSVERELEKNIGQVNWRLMKAK